MISLCMIIRNEEKNLNRSLSSVIDYVDEILITDTGSIDNSVSIAKEFGADVSYYNWNNDFSDARNFSIKNAKGDYILFIDADEEISPASWENIKISLFRNKGKAFRLTLKSKMESGINYGKSVRLFPNVSGIKFSGKAHEQVDESLYHKKIDVVEIDAEIIHHGYNVNDDELKQKAERNLKLLLSDYKTSQNSFTAFHLGVSYSILKNYDEAIKFYDFALLDKTLYSDYKVSALKSKALINFKFGKDQIALNLLSEAISINDNKQELYYLSSKILLKNNQLLDALEFCKKGLAVKDRTDFIIKDDFNYDEFVFHALLITLTASKETEFYQFLSLVNNNSTKKLIQNLTDQIADQNYPNKINEAINPDNESLLVALLFYQTEDIQKEILTNLDYNKIQSEKEILKLVGQIDRLNLQIDTESILNSYLTKYESPAVIAYLISIYLEKGDLQKIEHALEKLDVLSTKYPEVKRYVDLLKTQLIAEG